MIILDLSNESAALEDLLIRARADVVLIRARDGHEFILEPADDFEREVAALGAGEDFMQFLRTRDQEIGNISIEDLEKTLS